MTALSTDLSALQALWWEETDPKRAGELMLGLTSILYDRQQARRETNLRHAKLYANQDLSSIYDCGVAANLQGSVYLSINVTESCMNTLAAKMTRSRVRPSLMTVKGSRSLQRQAEQGTDWIDGVYYSNDVHGAVDQQVFVDGGLFGTGVTYTEGTPDREVVVERVLPDEIIVDETEAMYGPRGLMTIYRRKYIHRQALYRMRMGAGRDAKRFADDPEKKAAIQKANAWLRPGSSYQGEGGEMIPVTFGWRMPSKKGGDDGRFLVSIEGATLYSAKWTRMRSPLDFFTYQRRPVGFWGRGLAEQLVPIQLKINEQLETIDEGQRLNAQTRIVYQDGALDPDDFDNEVGRLIRLATGHTVNEVKEILGTGATPEMYADLERWVKRAYEITGISMLSATAEKPEGITSAVALRELLDREDLRFSDLGRRRERFHTDLGETILDTGMELAERGPVMVSVPGDKWVKRVDLKELGLDRDKHVVQVAAASALPTTPAARKQYADDLLERGAITMSRYLQIIDESGDVRGVTSMVTAIQESIDLDIEGILEKGAKGWRAPEKLRDPALARDTALVAYAKAVHEEVPEENLELLRRYILLATRQASSAGGGAATGQAGAQADAAAQQPQAAAGAPAPAVSDAQMLAPDLAAAAPQPVPPVAPAV